MPIVTAIEPGHVDALAALVGCTPLLEIQYRSPDGLRRIYAKYEVMNMTGSIKDRMTLHMIRCGFETGRLHLGDTIVEASNGNAGISFAGIGRALGYPVRIYIPDWMSRERIELKRDKGDDEVFGQLCRYTGWVGDDLIQMDGVPVAGIIIAAEITPKLEAAAKTNPNVRLVEYAIRLEFSPKG